MNYIIFDLEWNQPPVETAILLTYSRSYTGVHYAKRLIYEMSDDLWELYQDRKQLCHAET